MVEALRRSKFKFSGRQKIFVSKKFGFTKWGREVRPVQFYCTEPKPRSTRRCGRTAI
jgi:hypothetical protein